MEAEETERGGRRACIYSFVSFLVYPACLLSISGASLSVSLRFSLAQAFFPVPDDCLSPQRAPTRDCRYYAGVGIVTLIN